MSAPRSILAMGLAWAMLVGVGCKREEPEPPAVSTVATESPMPEPAMPASQGDKSMLDKAGDAADQAIEAVKEPIKEVADAAKADNEPSQTAKDAAAAGAADAESLSGDAAAWIASATAQLKGYNDKLPMLRDAASKLNHAELTSLVGNLEELIQQALGKLDSARAAVMSGDLKGAQAQLQPMLDEIKPLFDRAMELAQASGVDTNQVIDLTK